ncbi:hypothetical protein PVAP13_7KG077736 [Panicum virgatum]|uniref:Uncharacterized protein n=1 Tax=Panicum virgatum TaxID=38727 RepID=A0A8T0Q6X4_PANVG|nr:hypothetical protein PVAP13_7KG077736 [Panicum virgatum]
MAARRRRPSSLADLPTELAIRIAGRVAATSVRPMEGFRSLRATYHFMRCACRDPEVGRMYWYDHDGYLTLLPRLAQVGNLEACFIVGMIVVLRDPVIRPLPVIDKNLERAARGGHKVAAYVAAVLLYMANGGAGIDNRTWQYMRQAISDEPVKVPWGGAKMLSNEECYQIRERVTKLVSWLRMRRKAALPMRADLDPCKRGKCDSVVVLPWLQFGCKVFCSEDCRIRGKLKLFLTGFL